eukprot:CAMPEP_0185701986 /NCGR_PEP_ID=MMETSP1164-20130828/10802_1 /TAXON_ID=1104430 /ORGANISM="Chrysoreinhardia sp, Strain CCMP2950" /LENGTH=34 /DNA_ID= /DNA_START= /DNA_END= /DNA_ORIENTATION=
MPTVAAPRAPSTGRCVHQRTPGWGGLVDHRDDEH